MNVAAMRAVLLIAVLPHLTASQGSLAASKFASEFYWSKVILTFRV